MALVVRDLVDEARGFHPAFTVDRVPHPVAVQALARLSTRLVNKVLAISEDSLASGVFEVDNEDLQAAADADTPITLPDNLLIVKPILATRENSGIQVPVQLVDYASLLQHGPALFPSASLVGGTLKLMNGRDVAGTDASQHGWEHYTALSVRYVPMPVRPDAPADTVVYLPETARDALVCRLAEFFAGRTRTLSEIPYVSVQATDAEEMAVRTISGQDSTGSWYISTR